MVEKIISDHVDMEALIKLESDYKSKLIIAAQKEKKTLVFDIKLMENDTFNYYVATIFIQDRPICEGKGNTKKQAEQQASQVFFERGFKI